VKNPNTCRLACGDVSSGHTGVGVKQTQVGVPSTGSYAAAVGGEGGRGDGSLGLEGVDLWGHSCREGGHSCGDGGSDCTDGGGEALLDPSKEEGGGVFRISDLTRLSISLLPQSIAPCTQLPPVHAPKNSQNADYPQRGLGPEG